MPIRSFRRANQKQLNRKQKHSILAQSLDRADDEDVETLGDVEKISAEKNGAPVSASDLADAKGISYDQASRQLRSAASKGLVRQANPPERTNRKLYLPSQAAHFAPDPASVFQRLKGRTKIKFVHPLNGEFIVYRRRGDSAPGDDE